MTDLNSLSVGTSCAAVAIAPSWLTFALVGLSAIGVGLTIIVQISACRRARRRDRRERV
jgi:hypothetical protein